MADVLQWISSTNSLSVSGSSGITPVIGQGIDNNFSVTQTFQDGIAVSGSVVSSGATSGSVAMYMPLQGEGKLVVVTFNNYENDTSTNQSIAFPVPFSVAPLVLGNNTGLTLSTSASGLTITTPDSTTVYNGTAAIMGN